MKRKLWLAALVLAIVGIAAASMAATWHRAPSAEASTRFTYWLEGNDPTAVSQIKAAIKKSGAIPATASRDTADLIFTRSEEPGSTGVLPLSKGIPVPLTGAQLVQPVTAPSYYALSTSHAKASPDLRVAVISQLTVAQKTANRDQWTMEVVGDIGLGRSVYNQMLSSHDFLSPFSYFSDKLKSADLAIANLECAISDNHAVISNTGMTFVAPTAAAQGLKAAGFDAVSVANNHSFNAGAAGYEDTLAAIKRLGIAPFGGGLDDAAAHSPQILNVKGHKIALLGYSSITGSTPAGPASPGMAFISMAPWGPFSTADADRMAKDIKAAKAKADLVIVYYHWGTEYTHDANADQREIAHRAIDAGADLVLGAHPHWVQGVEWYHDHLIAYSLGNFIFDQDWATETKQGTMLGVTFQGNRLTGAELVPYEIAGNFQPRPAAAPASQQILADVFSHSWWPTQH